MISGEKGEARDWDRFRSLFRPEARLIPTGRRPDGSNGIRYMGIDDYIDGSGANLVQNGFFEKEVNRVQEGYENIVHLFSTYESRHTAADKDPFVRGINSFQLMNDGTRWWAVNIFRLGETEANPIPAEYLPSN